MLATVLLSNSIVTTNGECDREHLALDDTAFGRETFYEISQAKGSLTSYASYSFILLD